MDKNTTPIAPKLGNKFATLSIKRLTARRFSKRADSHASRTKYLQYLMDLEDSLKEKNSSTKS
ncbi:MAG: hypothetical protein GX452_01735 [Ignavibacteriales bacterium]|nr:hypothetical protein [Ignavibacteriales bacterium]